MRVTEIAWAAGFFDGEGCTSVSRKGPWRQVQMFVAQSGSPVLLHRFRRAVQTGRVRGPYRGSNPRAKLKYTWHVSSRPDALRVMRILRPFLGRVKRQQFKTAMEK